MGFGIYTGGTTGLTDGTLVSASNKLTFPSITTVLDAHIRCGTDEYSTQIDFDDIPPELEISFNAGSVWYGIGNAPFYAATSQGPGNSDVWDVNYPIKLRQVEVPPSADDTFTTAGTVSSCAALTTPTLTATANGSTQIDLSWTNVSNEDEYELDYSDTSGSGPWSALPDQPANDTSYSHTGLDASTQYWYRVRAIGSGRYSNSGYGTDDATTDAPADVSGFAVTSISGTTVNLGWSAFGGANHYKIERATDSGFTANLTTVSDAATGTSLADAGLTPNVTYYYRITAHDASHGALSGSGATCYAGVQVLVNPFANRGREVDSTHSTWAGARSGNNLVAGTLDASGGLSMYSGLFSAVYYANRAFQDFDGAAIPAASTIDEAAVRCTIKTNFGGTGFSIHKGSWTENPPDANSFGDFDATDLGGPSSWPSNNTPTWYALSSPDSNITKAGVTRLAFRDRSGDHADSAPANGTDTAGTLASNGDSTSGYRPQLRVSFHGV